MIDEAVALLKRGAALPDLFSQPGSRSRMSRGQEMWVTRVHGLFHLLPPCGLRYNGGQWRAWAVEAGSAASRWPRMSHSVVMVLERAEARL